MLTTNADVKPGQELTWDQRLLRNAGRNKNALRPEYQELKFTLHRKLLDKINLEALATIDNQRVRGEVRQAVISLIDGEQTLLSSLERQQIPKKFSTKYLAWVRSSPCCRTPPSPTFW